MYVATPGQRRLMASRSTRSGNILTIRGGALSDDNGDPEGGALIDTGDASGDSADEGEVGVVDRARARLLLRVAHRRGRRRGPWRSRSRSAPGNCRLWRSRSPGARPGPV